MSKGLVETITELVNPQAPLWACEFTQTYAIVAGVNSRRNRITSKIAAELPGLPRGLSKDGPLSPFKAVGSVESARSVVRQLLTNAGFKGSEIAVVIPDASARIAFLTAENPTRDADEQRTFIRWKLKKSIPFDVDTAQVAYRILGPHRGGPGTDMIVALSPRSIVHEYETLFEGLDIHAGMVLPSTLAALNLLNAPASDALFVKVAPECITTSIFQDRRVQFYRRVTDVTLYDAIYPTVLYYQDKLGGHALDRLFVCGFDSNLRLALQEVEQKLDLVPERLGPISVEDIYKPALGAIHLKHKPEGVAGVH